MMTKKNKKYKEKGVNLASKVPAKVARLFRAQAKERGQKIKTNLSAAIKLWTDLPDDVQARLLNQSLRTNKFIEIVQEIVDERIESGREAGPGQASKK